MTHSDAIGISKTAIFAAYIAVVIVGCAHGPQHSEPLGGTLHRFNIHWPPVDPNEQTAQGKPPLLRGVISIKETIQPTPVNSLEFALTITRPSSESDRRFWNSQLAFSDLPWMDEVRVWNSDKKWQWPNLPYLLRRHGVERIERYGGVDPGKHVDNDFAAVLVRRYDIGGVVESPDTLNSPLVSAEWYGDIEGETDIHSLVHVATSDTFVVHVGEEDEHSSGMLKVWLIYADFLGSRPPSTWPKEKEWAGGVLAFCEVVWDKVPGKKCHGTVRFCTPPAGTGFDWVSWSDAPSAPAPSRLTDVSP